MDRTDDSENLAATETSLRFWRFNADVQKYELFPKHLAITCRLQR